MPEHTLSDPPHEAGGMEAQLVSLYAERDQLHNALGTADAGEIIAMVHSLETQCNDLYQDKDEAREDAK